MTTARTSQAAIEHFGHASARRQASAMTTVSELAAERFSHSDGHVGATDERSLAHGQPSVSGSQLRKSPYEFADGSRSKIGAGGAAKSLRAATVVRDSRTPGGKGRLPRVRS